VATRFWSKSCKPKVRDAELGKRYVDKLVQVHRLSGQEDWIYLHLEVQGSAQAEFAKRMFVYNYRIFDRYDRPVASMAVLADDSADWKPQQWGYDVFDCQMAIRFPVAKLTDYAAQEQTLADDPNPFALVTLAHLQTKATRKHALMPNGNWSSCCSTGAGPNSASSTCCLSSTG